MNRIERFSIVKLPVFGFLLWCCLGLAIPSPLIAGTTPPKVVIIEFHGLKQNIIRDNLAELPHFRELIAGPDDRQAYVYLSNVMTTIPAASVPACTAMYTGRTPQHTGVVSTIWFDRRALQVRTMISWGQDRINKELDARGVPTIFDYVAAAGKRSLSCMLIVNKGADWKISSNPFFWGNASALGFIKGGRLFPHKSYTDPKTISAFLDGHILAGRKSIKGLMKRDGELPDLMVVQLLGMDLDAHFPERRFVKQGATIDSIQADYVKTILDPQIGRLIRSFKEIGAYENTIFFLVSQQGALKISKHIDDNLLARILQPDFTLLDASTGSRLADAVIMPGACTKEIYLKNRGTGRWEDPPRLLADVKPAIDLLLSNNQVREALNAMVVRQCPGEQREGLPENDQWWHFEWEAYVNADRTDQAFLDALKPLAAMARRFELKERVVEGLNRQYTRQTAPDIKLVNKKGEYFVTRLDKYGHHGSYYPEDTVVSFWLAGPGLSTFFTQRHVITETSSTLDLVPMTCHLLGLPIPTDLDGQNPLSTLP